MFVTRAGNRGVIPGRWEGAARAGRRVGARLRITFKTLDASAEYKKSVIDNLLTEYRAGRTPNPDVMCNREVKFGAFYRYAMSSGADAIAMGHYRSGEKDQSYFLWAVPKDILDATIFPVGNMSKEKVRALAKQFNLPVAEKKDSQGICFLGSVSVEEFLRRELGSDNPALLYTIGQRASRPGGPWYVVGKDVGKKEIKVSKTRTAVSREIFFTDANWFDKPEEITEAQYRYRGPRVRGRVERDQFIAEDQLPDIPAPGQSIVFYHGANLIGGGIIAS